MLCSQFQQASVNLINIEVLVSVLIFEGFRTVTNTVRWVTNNGIKLGVPTEHGFKYVL